MMRYYYLQVYNKLRMANLQVGTKIKLSTSHTKMTAVHTEPHGLYRTSYYYLTIMV